MEEITIRTLDAAGMTPLRAYAAIRAKTSGRTSFFIETTGPGEHFTTIGFLVKQEAALPAPAHVAHDIVTTASELPARSDRPEVAASCVHDVLLLIAFDAVNPLLRVEAWPDQSFIGREVRSMASLVFDHEAGTMTIVATNPNVVERAAREITAAPELAELPEATGEGPEYLSSAPSDAALAKQLLRAERRLGGSELERLLLGRVFKSQPFGADLFDVMRALREQGAGRHRFFFDMPRSPSFPPFGVAAAGDGHARGVPATDAASLTVELLARLRVDAVAGAPGAAALRALRELDVGSRGMRGGALVRIRPGGRVDIVSTDTAVVLEEEQLQTPGVAPVVPGRDVDAHTAECERDAKAALMAIRRAQDAARVRDAAAGGIQA